MALWTWRTLPDERVEVDKGRGYQIYELDPIPHGWVENVMQWRALAEEMGAKHGVPASWILAVIHSESGGDPKAKNYCCYGLMAIMASVHDKTPEELLDPRTNVDYGSSLLATSRHNGLSLPEAASVHVAGAEPDGSPHPSTKSPWGMREHLFDPNKSGDGSVGYIDRVVRANNVYVKKLEQALPPPGKTPPGGHATPPPARAGMGTGAMLGLFAVGGAVGWGATKLLPRLG